MIFVSSKRTTFLFLIFFCIIKNNRQQIDSNKDILNARVTRNTLYITLTKRIVVMPALYTRGKNICFLAMNKVCILLFTLYFTVKQVE